MFLLVFLLPYRIYGEIKLYIVLLKLPTERHKASRGLSVTAELLVTAETRNSAVADRPRDAACLSLVTEYFAKLLKVTQCHSK